MAQVTIFESLSGKGHIAASNQEVINLTQTQHIIELCDKITAARAAGDDELAATLKKQLPAIAPNAHFYNGQRKTQCATPNGYAFIDIDHPADQRAVDREVWKHRQELALVFAQHSISGGCHFIIRRQPNETISQALNRFHAITGIWPDMACKDLTRLMFLTSSRCWIADGAFDPAEEAPAWLTAAQQQQLRVNVTPEMMNFEKEPLIYDAPLATAHGVVPTHAACPLSTARTLQTHYRGTPLIDIVAALLDIDGGAPQQGERNNRFFLAASELRNITDYDPEAIITALTPFSTLPPAELRQTVASATKYREHPVISPKLSAAIAIASTPDGTTTHHNTLEINFPLPPALQAICNAAPPHIRTSAIVSAIVLFGTLMSKRRSRYNDREQHPTFHHVVIGEQGSGKSYIDRLIDLILPSLLTRDKAAKEAHAVWERDYEIAKTTLGQTKEERARKAQLAAAEPSQPIRMVSMRISMTSTLKRMAATHELHVLQILPEIMAAVEAEKKGWSDIKELLKISFDGGPFSQDYSSKDSWTGVVKDLFNVEWAAQPSTFSDFFTPSKWVDGTAMRFIFTDIPSLGFAAAPQWRPFTEEEEAAIKQAAAALDNISIEPCGTMDDAGALSPAPRPESFIAMPHVEAAMQAWQEEQRQQAQTEQNKTRLIYRQRAHVLGFRAAMVVQALWGKDDEDTRANVIQFARWFADVALQGHLAHAPKQHAAGQAPSKPSFLAQRAYDALGDTFTRQELLAALKDNGLISPPHVIINTWCNLGIITRDKPRNPQNFQKLPPNSNVM